MGEASNCSYVSSGSVVQGCAEDQAFCCLQDGLPVCSSTACSAASGTSSGSNLDKLIFWVILAALAGVLCIVLFIVYLVCRFRKHKFDYLDGKRDSVFEETVCEAEIRTITKAEKPAQVPGTTVHVQEATTERRVVQVTPRPSRLPVRPTNAQSATPRPNPGLPRDGGVSPAWNRVSGLVRQQHLTQSSLRLSHSSRSSPSWSRVSAVVHQQERQPRGRETGTRSPGWGRANSLRLSKTGYGSPTGSGTPSTARKVSPRGVLPDVQ